MNGATDQVAVWLRRLRPASGRPLLVCFPHAGGSASFFLPYARELDTEADVVSVQYPGRQDRRHEQLIGSVTGLADAVLPHVVEETAERPVVLFGHSLGALVAFEVARRIEGDGRRVDHLVVSGRRSPSVTRDLGRRRPTTDEELVRELADTGGTDPRLLADPELMALVLPVLRNDYQAAESYRGGPGVLRRCPVTAFAGSADALAPEADVREWARFTEAEFDMEVFDGGHFFVREKADAVARAVRSRLLVMRSG